jgi:cell wall-associated NlpC family hydrolase
LSVLTSTVTEHVGTIGRGGVVLAMSSGLVATMGLPAQALTKAAPEAAAPATAPIAVQPALGFSGSLIASPAGFQSSAAPLTAPAAAAVTFDSGVFAAVPAKAPPSASGGTRAGFTGGGVGSARGQSVLAIASRYIGVAYRYGGTTPSGWDCSGAVGYIFDQVGINLPRTANQQLLASRRVSRSEARPGDLVFMTSGGSAYHVGIFAGGNLMYDSGRSGKSFSKRQIWTSDVIFGRVS